MRKTKIIIFILIISIATIIFFSIRELLNNNLVSLNEDILIDDEYDEEETTSVYWRFEDPDEVAYWVAQKNGDWSDLPLTDVFREKYNEKDGVFGDMQFDKVEYNPYKYDGRDYPFEDYNYLVVTQGKKKTVYVFWLVPDGYDGFNDFEIMNVYQLTDEDGNEIDYREGITEKNFESQMHFLSEGGRREQSVGVTKKFHEKYPFFFVLFEHYSPFRFNPIEFIPEKSSWKKKEAYFVVNSVLECKKRYYKVKFTLDEKNFIDDVEVKSGNEAVYEGTNRYRSDKLLYNNSKWDGLEITNNYIEKFKMKSYNKDILNIDIDYSLDAECIDEPKGCEYLTKHRMKNGETSIYYVKYIMDEKGYVDDIICKKLDYDNIDLKEAAELYKKEHSKNTQ